MIALLLTGLGCGSKSEKSPAAPAPSEPARPVVGPSDPEPRALPGADPTRAARRRPAAAPLPPDPVPELPDGKARTLFAKGDHRAKQKKYAEALSWWRWGYVKSLPRLRELGFKYPVDARFMDRDQLRERMSYELGKELPPKKMLAEQLSGIALGFYPPDIDLRAMMTNLYTEEVAGFYDPDTKDLVLIADGPDQKKKKGLLNLLLGSGGFDPQEQRAVLSHELAHALADQHFDLLSLHKSASKDDDMMLGLTALIEGEAMVVMVLDVLPEGERKDFLLAPPGLIAGLMKLVVPLAASFMGGDTFRTAPKLLQETLLMPYTDGLRFGLTLMQEGGWQRIDAAFGKPPISSEQVLHPEKYLSDPPDTPMALSFPKAAPPGLDGWRLVKENTAGEFAIRVRLSMERPHLEAKRAAAGWDGDTYRVYARGDGTTELLVVWATTWDSEKDAVEAQRSFSEVILSSPSARVWRKGNDVWAITGAPSETLTPLMAWAERIERKEKVLVIEKATPKKPFPSAPDPRLLRLAPKKTGRPTMGYDPKASPILKLLGLSDRELVAKGVSFADEVCACKDLDCVAAVDARMKPWFEAARKRRIVVAEFEQLKTAFIRYKACIVSRTQAALEATGVPTPNTVD